MNDSQKVENLPDSVKWKLSSSPTSAGEYTSLLTTQYSGLSSNKSESSGSSEAGTVKGSHAVIPNARPPWKSLSSAWTYSRIIEIIPDTKIVHS